MFAISVRVSPCSARSSPRSVGRVTVTTPSSWEIRMRCGTCWRSSPFGPETVTRPGSTETITPAGTSIGRFPILLKCSSPETRLPHVAQDFAADALGLGGAARDDAAGGGHDRDAHAAEHALAASLAGVHAATGLRDAL